MWQTSSKSVGARGVLIVFLRVNNKYNHLLQILTDFQSRNQNRDDDNISLASSFYRYDNHYVHFFVTCLRWSNVMHGLYFNIHFSLLRPDNDDEDVTVNSFRKLQTR